MAVGRRERTHPAGSTEPGIAALMSLRGVGVVVGHGPRIEDANAELLRIAGRSAAELAAGLEWRDLAPADAPERLVAAAQNLLREGSTTATIDVVRPDRTRVEVLLVAVLLEGPDQPWLALVVDLTDEQWRGRLAEYEAAIVSTLLDDAPIGFALFDRDLTFLRINREMAAMNGLPPAAHIGRPAFDVVPGVRGSAEEAMRSVIESGQPLRDVEVVGTTDADPGVVHVWLESFFPVRSQPDAPVQGIAAVARDVTRVRALQAELAEAMRRQRTALEQLQRAILPDALPRVPGWSFDARYISASDLVRLGGDWFDVVPVGPRLVLSVGDAVGHGLAAVGTMAHARAAIRAFLSEGYGPGDVLERVGRLLHTPGVDAMATAVVVCLDPETGEFEYASAGHPYLVAHDPGGPATLLTGAQGPMLGVLRHEYATASGTLAPGGSLVLYSDGLVERRRESLSVGLARLRAAVEAAGGVPVESPAASTGGRGGGRAPATERVDDVPGPARRLVDAVLAACGADSDRDDICLLAAVREDVSR